MPQTKYCSVLFFLPSAPYPSPDANELIFNPLPPKKSGCVHSGFPLFPLCLPPPLPCRKSPIHFSGSPYKIIILILYTLLYISQIKSVCSAVVVVYVANVGTRWSRYIHIYIHTYIHTSEGLIKVTITLYYCM